VSFQTSALIVTWVALVLMAFVVAGLVRQVHALSSGGAARQVPAGLRAGDAATGLDVLGVEAPAVLLFLRSTCSTCVDVLDEAASGATPVVALYEGRAPDAPPGVVAVGDQARLFAAYGALATPFAVLVGPGGRITAATPVGSREAVRTLLDAVRTT
jgi:hypothetical protein